MTPDTIVAFWREAGPARWFSKDEAFDALCRQRFLAAWEDAVAGKLAGWATTPSGSLALLILLDQLPRNMFRGSARTYASDTHALEIARAAIDAGHDRQVEPELRRFFYLPFMHSEALDDQDRSVALNEALGDADILKWARHHRDIVARFGRFPHRNALLGRTSTAEESDWIADEAAFKG